LPAEGLHWLASRYAATDYWPATIIVLRRNIFTPADTPFSDIDTLFIAENIFISFH
jgi:hypothetical protein